MLDTNNNTSTQTTQTLPLTDSDKAELKQRGLTPKQIEAVSAWRFNRIVREARARRDARNAQRKAVAK